MSTLNADDVALLSRPLHGVLTVAGDTQPPQPRPVWYEADDDGTVRFFTLASSPKVRRLQRDPRASLVVAAPVGEREHWVSVAGPVVTTSDGAHDLARRLAARYWGPGERADDLAAMLAEDLVRVDLRPQTVHRSAY